MNHVYNQQSEGLNRYSREDLVVKKCCDLHKKMQLLISVNVFHFTCMVGLLLMQASKVFNLLGCQKVVTYI